MSIDPEVFRVFVKTAGPQIEWFADHIEKIGVEESFLTQVLGSKTHPGFAHTREPELMKKLRARHPDIPIRMIPGGDNALYMSSRARDLVQRPGRSLVLMPSEGATRALGMGSPEVLAHELGHREFARGGLGKVISHPIFRGLALNDELLGATGFGAGFAEGRWRQKRKAEGKKTTKIPLGGLVPLAITAPLLVDEGMASLKALKALREVGASPATLSRARGNLGRAFASYLSAPALGLAAYAGGRGVAHITRPQDRE